MNLVFGTINKAGTSCARRRALSSGFMFPFVRRLGLIGAAILILVAIGCPQGAPEGKTPEIRVFAAASTTDVMSRLAAMYEKDTGVQVTCSFAASSTLARQIESGAPADVWLSAHPEWMDRLEEKGMIEPGTRRDLLGNTLVLISPGERRFEIGMQSGAEPGEAFEGRVALGDPDHVPAGRYAREALEFLGWWDELEDRLLPAMDVRDALRIVALGEAGAGIVYATDAAMSEGVEVVGAFPEASHAPIRYPIAIVKDAPEESGAFIDFLFSDEAAAVYESAGFLRIDGS